MRNWQKLDSMRIPWLCVLPEGIFTLQNLSHYPTLINKFNVFWYYCCVSTINKIRSFS